MKNTLSKISGLLISIIVLGIPARAISINDPGVVGTIVSGEPASVSDEVWYVNSLLGLGANVVDQIITDPFNPFDDHKYSTSSTDYNGTVSDVGSVRAIADDLGFSLHVSGFDYVLAKYDGPNGGDVVWFLGGVGFDLPSDSSGLWSNPAGQGYGISHWTAFDPHTVPDGGATVALLGLGLLGLAGLRRRFIRR
jgi:hypothetical protein